MKKLNLLEDNITKIMVQMALPMILGLLSVISFNLADTYFLGLLGLEALSAMGFAFPMIIMVTSISLALSAGATSVISKAIGQGDKKQIQRLTTDSLLLALIFVFVFSLTGLLTMDVLFPFLGAKNNILVMIKEYMYIWYIGVGFLVFPFVGNAAIRATGDAKFPGIVMAISSLANIILDPMFIFGWGVIPAMGVKGAAIASLISRVIAFLASFYYLYHKEKMITLKIVTSAEILNSWKKILYITLPSLGTYLMMPISHAVIIKLLSQYGTISIAAINVIQKIESLGLLFLMALASVIAPISGQNWGGKKISRIKTAIKKGYLFSFVIGIFIFITYSMFSYKISGFFTSVEKVKNIIVTYFYIVGGSYGFQGLIMLNNSMLNALKKPFHSGILIFIRLFVLYIPLAYVGSHFFNIYGIFIALSISNLIGGLISFKISKNVLNKL